MLREFVSNQVLRQVLRSVDLDPAEAPLRASLVASQLAGLALVRYVIKLEPLASLPHDAVVAAIGPNIQRYVTGPLS
jgi:hypothetical protein